MVNLRFFSFLVYCRYAITLIAFIVLVAPSCEKIFTPVAIDVDFTWNENIIDGVVHFETSTTYDKPANLTWSWTFGDEFQDPHTLELSSPTHVYSKSGAFLVSLTVKDPIENKEQVVIKEVDVRYFNDRPSAKIIDVTSSIFGSTIRCQLYEGTKYEYEEPDPEFFLEVSKGPDFKTLESINGNRDKTAKLQSSPIVDFVAIGLSPNTQYYARVRTVRESFLKQGVLTQVSNSPSPILGFKTGLLPEVDVLVDTTTNPQLIIIKSQVPQSLLVGGEVEKTLTIYKDNDLTTPYDPPNLFPDSVFYREPGTQLTFIYTYSYLQELTGITHNLTGKMTIYTPNVLMGIDDDIYRSDAIPTISDFNRTLNHSRRIRLGDLNTTVQLNQTLEEGTIYVTDAFGYPIRDPRTSTDAYSYITTGINNITYYHVGNNYGNLYIYKEDDQYIYARMTQGQEFSSYRKGFIMVNRSSANSQQSARELFFKGLVFKAAKQQN